MLARARTFTIEGLRARAVTVEVDVRSGLPAFTVVGLADAAIREARERVRTAILNSGYEFPQRRITANLAPADLPKAGPGIDLALACAVLAASGQLSDKRLTSYALFGELSLDGRLRPCHGTLAVAQAAQEAGMQTLVLSPARASEATLVDDLDIAVAGNLGSTVRILEGGSGDALPKAVAHRSASADADLAPAADLGDVRGQRVAIGALLLAAAGGHNLLLSGPPGTGKTMIAQRLPGILPALTQAEAIEVTRIHSIAGRLTPEHLVHRRPFRAPHHTITAAGLVGGARRGSVGEVVLAHRGVLFLDELGLQSSTIYPDKYTLLSCSDPPIRRAFGGCIGGHDEGISSMPRSPEIGAIAKVIDKRPDGAALLEVSPDEARDLDMHLPTRLRAIS